MDNNSCCMLFAALPLATLAAPVSAQEAAGDGTPIEQIVVTGTRVANRSALDTAVPVDVVSGNQLQNLGVAEVSQAL